MDCKYGYKCFECPEKDCNVEEKDIKEKKILERKQYYKNYYQAHKGELSERARLRARRLKAEAKFNKKCYYCGKQISSKKAFVFRKKYFCSKTCLKNYLLSKVKDDVKGITVNG